MGNPDNCWIPVERQLPSRDGRYLITEIDYGQLCVRVADFTVNFPNEINGGRSVFLDYTPEHGFYERKGVLAWMDLPEPYHVPTVTRS